MKKVAMFVFNGSPMCFVHVLLNALDMHARGDDVRIVMEGEATKLVPELALPENWLHALWQKARDKGLVDGACKACSQKLGVLDAVAESALPLMDDMSGHPGMARFQADGYEIITF
ncbi:MAG: DsrE family protein [Deltaproteobacteria bacterium]|jgi:hypothetical protein|nr:DsrE family protein [Deltaproteobacteria bacterium]